MRPSNWYLTGFLIPVDAPEEQAADADGDDDFDDVPESEGPGEESADDRVGGQEGVLPVVDGAQHARRAGRDRR